ncbi:MAG: translocation/assembly module TamB domain-containing protein [Prevotella sp.]
MAWTLAGVYMLGVVLLHIPAVQHAIAYKTSKTLQEKLGTKVSVGNISLGLLNRIVIDEVMIEDHQHQKMFSCHRVSAKLDVSSLIEGRIVISSAQIFGMRAALTKASVTSPLNCQFILDSLASKDTASKTPLNLQISSLVIRNSSLSYDRQDKARRYGSFDINHLDIGRISGHIMLYALTDDTLSLRMKKLVLEERNSGLCINKLAFIADAGKKSARLRGFSLQTTNSDIGLDIALEYNGKDIRALSMKSDHSSIGTNDIALFVPKLKGTNRSLFFDTEITGDSNNIRVKSLSINNSGREIALSLTGSARARTNIINCLKDGGDMSWSVPMLTLHAECSAVSELIKNTGIDTSIIARIGSIDLKTSASGTREDISAETNITSGIGDLTSKIALHGERASLDLSSTTLRLGHILNNGIVGDTELSLHGTSIIDRATKRPRKLDADISLPLLTLNGYPYRNIEANVGLEHDKGNMEISLTDINAAVNASVSAENIMALLGGRVAELKNIMLRADVSNISPHALNLTKSYPGTSFGMNVDVMIGDAGAVLDNLTANINNLRITGESEHYSCERTSLSSIRQSTGGREMELTSDFANIHATGQYDIRTLGTSLMNLISQRLPTLPGIPHYTKTGNTMSLAATIYDTRLLNFLAGTDISHNSPISIKGYINDALNTTDITLKADSMAVSGMRLKAASVHLSSPGDTLHLAVNAIKHNSDGGRLSLGLTGKAANNNVDASLRWDNGCGDKFKGSLNIGGQFFRNIEGKATAKVNISPSEVMINDSLWNLRRAEITYSSNCLDIDNFLLEHGEQHIRINGMATRLPTDSLTISMKDVDVAYIMNLVDFHSVEFDGYATGEATATSVFSTPQAHADLKVRDFLFEKGRMGTLTVSADWDNTLGQINIKGRCDDPGVKPLELSSAGKRHTTGRPTLRNLDGRTIIDGYVSIKKNYIDLDIQADNTRLEFMNTFCDSFLDNVTAWANGRLRLWGDLSKINLTGDAVVNGKLHVTPLNTTYTLENDTVSLVYNDILFNKCKIADAAGNTATVTGGLHHKHLARLTFDIDINASHLLCYDFPTLDGSTFCGHVVGSGTCRITGRPGEITFDIEAFPEKNTEIVYNVSSPDAIQDQEFITWRDRSLMTADEGYTRKAAAEDEEDDDFRSDIRMNFLIHTTTDNTLRLIMDERTGDYITLNGTGTLRATYFNKGGMEIFGNYNVQHGEYKMTIQQVITKNFTFLPGGTIAFGGPPFEADVNLEAQYIVPSVPLSDLSIGNSFSNNSVRVNCLMNITGTAEHPIVDFDLNIPQASTDVQQMITTLMDSEQERNQQVIYLLTVGRFFSGNDNVAESGQSRTAVAMQSFLSGTLSQQLNNIISDVVLKSQNWNFGANISPGDEGMMNAEYEGLISGRMLNNRLLINGQFGYRDNANATTSFIGDFDIRYLLFPNGNLQVKVYNQTSDRYFTKSNLNTQGLGIVWKHDFNYIIPYWNNRKQKKEDVTRQEKQSKTTGR